MTQEIIDAYPLTPLQKGMLFEVLSKPDSNLFIGSASFDFKGAVDVPRFIQSWRAATKLFAVLRTQFVWDGVEEPLQLVLDNCDIKFELVDCSALFAKKSAKDRNDHLTKLRLDYRQVKIEIDQCPLMFLKLIKWSNDEYTLCWQIHHLVMDAWSASIVFKAVLELYQESDKLPHLQAKQLLPFSHYVHYLKSSDTVESNNYWADYLASVVKSDLNIPARSDHLPKCLVERATYSISQRNWDKQKSGAIKAFCSTHSITLAGLIHGAWAILVSAYSNTRAPYFGSVASGRYAGMQGIDSAVGLFINTLPICTPLDSERTIVQWIEGIQTQLQSNQRYGQVGLQDIKQHLAIGPESSVFDTVLSIEPELLISEIESIDSDLTIKDIQFAVDSDVPLSMIFDPKDEFKVELSFNPEIIDQSIAEQIQSDFMFIVDSIVSQPTSTSSSVLLSLQQKYRLDTTQTTSTYDTSDVNSSEYSDVASWLRKTSHELGSRIAIESTQSSIDFNQFADFASIVSYQLRDALAKLSGTDDIENDSPPVKLCPVGVCATSVRSQIVSFFGVLDAELTYMPIDPEASDERLKNLVKKSHCQFVITDTDSAKRFSELDVITIDVDNILGSNAKDAVIPQGGESTHWRNVPELYKQAPANSTPENPAYIMYTSGSTGEPKGVVVSHANLIYSTQARINYYREQQPRFMLLSPTVFDSSVVGIYWTLLGGGSLIVPERDEVKDVQLIANLIELHQVDTILCLPTYHRLLLDGASSGQLNCLKRVILAGEECSGDTVDLHHQSIPHAELYNEYGPTECTVWSSVERLNPHQSQVTIGQAIPGTSINIVDEQGYPVPAGTIGEIVVAGPGVSDGYWLDELETSKRFCSTSAAFDGHSVKSYRTGDLGSFTTDQQLLFHGRIDRQIKIRGHRIEPAEIESVVMNIPAVAECVAVGVSGAAADVDASASTENLSRKITGARFSQIALYLTAASSLRVNERRVNERQQERQIGDSIALVDLCNDVLHRVKNTLPAHMHPAQVFVVDEFPKTATGKLDIDAIQAGEILAEAGKTGEKTSSTDTRSSNLDASVQHTLSQLEAVAEDVLQVSKIHADDTFYELGGDSISAIMFVSRARERGLSCDIKQLAAQKSFGAIAAELVEIERSSENAANSFSHVGASELTPIQRWYFSLQNPNPAHWSIAYRISLNHATKIGELSNSITNALNRFPAIGSRFTKDSAGWHCHIPESFSGSAPTTTLAYGADSNQQLDSELKQLAESWDLEKGWMIGFVFIENEPELTNELYLVVHHLVLDHIAISLLLRHILGDAGYLGKSDRTIATEPMSIRECASITGETQSTAESTQWLSLAESTLNEPRPFSTEEHSNYTVVKLSEQDTKELIVAAEAANVNLLEVLATVLSIVWRRNASDQLGADLDLYIEASGRELSINDRDISDVIGWMTLFYPLDKSAINYSDIYETLKSIKNSLRQHKENHYQYLNWYFQRYKGCPTQGAANATCLINYLGDSSSLLEANGYTINVCKKRFLRDKKAKRPFDIELNAYTSNNQLHLDWYVEESTSNVFIENLSREMINEVIGLANRLREQDGQPVYTPSDFSLASLSQDELDNILRDID